MSKLSKLREQTMVVADTGEINAIKRFKPQGATTNPSLIYKAVQIAEYQHFLDRAIADSQGSGLSGAALYQRVIDLLLVAFGREILSIIPGRVSTEVDARLSFDREKTIEKAHFLISQYEKNGIARERVLIKVASTWEGIEAAKVLTQEGIHCNLTLLFSLPQAIACAEARVQLISPFVGRIMDWHKAKTGKTYTGAEDPGVQSVQTIFNYYKKFGYKTEIMGASFRNTDEILELAGCDLLTISPSLLQELEAAEGAVPQKLDASAAQQMAIEKIEMNEKVFRWLVNENAMATEKLAEGIRNFAADTVKLEQQIAAAL